MRRTFVLNYCSTTPVLDQMEQGVQAKINTLIAAGKAHCTYLPPQRQSSNCSSTGSGLNCSGSLNKTIHMAQCPEIAVYAGAVNLNNDLSASKLFIATSNNLTLNHSGKGVYASRGNLNSNLNGNRKLEGFFVAGGTSNLNLSGTPELKGLYRLLNNAPLSMNMNGNARFEGALCSTGQVNANRNGNTKTIYHPDILLPWLSDVPNLADLICDARPNFYTQTIPKNCSVSVPPASLDLNDPLYVIQQTLAPAAGNNWYKMPGRSLPVPADWYSADGQKYMLTLNNHGMTSMITRWFTSETPPAFPQSVRVIPRIDCITPNRNDTFTAYLGYENQMPGVVNIPIGPYNHAGSENANAGQPTQFNAGSSLIYPQSVHAVQVRGNSFTWALGARSVSVQANDPAYECSTDIFQVPSTTSVRKILAEEMLSIGAGTHRQSMSFQISDPLDIKRRGLLTIKLGDTTTPVQQLEVLFNGQALSLNGSHQLIANGALAITVEPEGMLKVGTNIIEVVSASTASAQINLRLDGFMLPVNIPGAVHSMVPHDDFSHLYSHTKGIVSIKFLEGMNIQPSWKNNTFYPKELNGIQFPELDAFIANNNVLDVFPTVYNYQDFNALETEAELERHQELPNLNLFYNLRVSEETDIWALVEQLRKLPYLEDAYPRFEVSVDSDAEPNDPELTGAIPGFKYQSDQPVDKSDWLRFARILTHEKDGQQLPGAWEYNRGSSDVTLGIVDSGFHISSSHFQSPNHEDFVNASGLRANNISHFYNHIVTASDPVIFKRHGTQTLGVIAAIPNNNKGVAGVADKSDFYAVSAGIGEDVDNLKSSCTIHKIQYEFLRAFNAWASNPPLPPYDVNRFPCFALLDNLVLGTEYQNNDEKRHILSVSIAGDPYTIEQISPEIRAYFSQQSSKTAIIYPAGNNVCNSPQKLGEPPVPESVKEACRIFFMGTKPVNFQDRPGFDITRIPRKGLKERLTPRDPSVHKDLIPMPDTGTIIVGGLYINGKYRVPEYSRGASVVDNICADGNIERHGIDVGGPYSVWTTQSYPANTDPKYARATGTSFAVPAVAGVVSLMLTANSSLKPREIRRILRCTAQWDLLYGVNGETNDPIEAGLVLPHDTAGMVNAYEAVKMANGGQPPPGFETAGNNDNCNKWYVRAFNIDDNAAIYLNQDTVPVISKGYKGDTDFVYVNSFLQPDTNKFRFELYNQLGGYAWGFQVKKNVSIHPPLENVLKWYNLKSV